MCRQPRITDSQGRQKNWKRGKEFTFKFHIEYNSKIGRYISPESRVLVSKQKQASFYLFAYSYDTHLHYYIIIPDLHRPGTYITPILILPYPYPHFFFPIPGSRCTFNPKEDGHYHIPTVSLRYLGFHTLPLLIHHQQPLMQPHPSIKANGTENSSTYCPARQLVNPIN